MKHLGLNKQTLLHLLSENSLAIRKLGVRQLGIFGSFVRNEATENSDVDFFVDFFSDKKNFNNFMELAFLLQNITGRKIEIITPQSLSKYFGNTILNDVEYVPLAA